MDTGRSLPLALATCLAFMASSPAVVQAALFRAYLSVNGNDANPCTLPAPCRLLPAALAAVDDGGDVWMLDSGNFNTGPVIVTKSVSILAVPGVEASLVATTSRALDVNGAGVKVSLRNLSFRELNSTGYAAVYFLAGASLLVENCRFSGIPGGGIAAGAPNGRLMVRDTVIRQNGGSGVEVSGSMHALLDRVEITQNAVDGVRILDGAKVAIVDSAITGNANAGIEVLAMSGGSAQAIVERSTLSGNFGSGISAGGSNPGSDARAVVARSVLSGNGYSGAGSSASSGGTATVVLEANTFTEQPRGVFVSGSGSVVSRQNNLFTYHTTADSAGGSPTPLAGQ